MLPTLFISILLFAFILVIAGLGFRVVEIQEESENSILKASASRVINRTLDTMYSVGQVILKNTTLVNSLDLDNQFDAIDYLDGYNSQTEVNFVTVYDRNFEIFARSDQPGNFGHRDELLPELIAAMESGEISFSVEMFENKLSFIHIVPLKSINGSNGVLAIGRYIDSNLMNSQRGSYVINITVDYRGKPWRDGYHEEARLRLTDVDRLQSSPVVFSVLSYSADTNELIVTKMVVLLGVVLSCIALIFYFTFKWLNQFSERISWVADRADLLVTGKFPDVPEAMKENDEMGELIRSIGIANQAIKQYLAGLNNSLSEQTSLNKEMARAKDEAEKMVVAKSQFLSNMSHEIRTPLNGVIGLLDIIDCTPLSSKDQQLVETAKQSGLSLIQIVNDILILSKLEIGKDDLENKPFSLKALIEKDVKILSPEFECQRISFIVNVDIEEKCNWLKGDNLRLSQIIKNLLGNALKFSNSGGTVTYDVVCRSLDDKQADLMFSIRDEGIGISPENFKKIFESFQQADGSITRRFGGTGLGLSICQKLVNVMKGTLNVESVVEEGSCFTVSLPMDKTPKPKTVVTLKEGSDDSYILYQSETCHILLVEDNMVNIMVAKGMLKKVGLKPDVATNGQEALEALEKKDYNLIFMDCQMPVMDGYEATRQIRLKDIQIPIVAMTANTLPGDREKCLSVGMSSYMSKPINLKKLSAELEQWLPSSEGHRVTSTSGVLRSTPLQ